MEEDEREDKEWEEHQKKILKELEEEDEREKKEMEEKRKRQLEAIELANKLNEEKRRREREEEEKLKKLREEKRKKELEEYQKQLEKQRKEWEEQERIRREQEEKQRIEYERQQREWEEKQRKRREEQERIRKEREEKERKEYEERQRKRREEEERLRKEREEQERREYEEYQKEMERRRKQMEEEERKRREEEERRRKEWEEQERKRREEEERKRKEEEDIIRNTNRGRIDILATLDKEKLKKIVKALPKRTSLSLNSFREHFKAAVANLTEEEKAYALFFWICDNIAYDVEALRTGNLRCEPEESYNRGMTVCSGYSRLYKYIGVYAGIDVICVMGHAKGATNEDISESNHEWNILRFKKVYYIMDSTWGAGTVGDKFTKELCEFYFCPIPDRIIATHHPDEDKWQLLYPFVSLQEFGRLVKYSSHFYQLFTTDIKYKTIKVKSQHTIRFNKINPNDNLGAIVAVYDKNGRETKNALCIPIYNKDYIEFFYIFKKKGTYKTDIFASPKSQKKRNHIVEYMLECTEDFKITASTPFSLPTIYENDIIIIEPIFNVVKKGKKVTFKFRCDTAEEIIITNGEWITLKKNQDGIFETTLTIQTDSVHVGIKDRSNSFDTAISYKA